MVVALQDRQRARSGVNVSTVPPRPRTRRDRAADQTRKIPAQPGRGQANSPAVNARRAASTSTTVITRPLRLHPPEHAVPTAGQATGELGLHHRRPIGGRQPLRPNGSRRPAASRCTPIPGPPRPFPARTRLVLTTASHTTSPTDTPHTFFSMTRWAPPNVALNTRPPGRQRGNLHRESSIPVVHRSASGRDRILGTWQATRVWRRLRHR